MATAVGRCMLLWANVEQSLALLFNLILSPRANAVGDEMLATVRGFDGKLKIIDAAFAVVVKHEAIRSDWSLIYNYALRQSELRNQVAHATAINAKNETVVLEPFYSLTKRRVARKDQTLSIDDTNARAHGFLELAKTIRWVMGSILQPPKQPGGDPSRTPDLVHRLREKASQSRARKRRPPKPSRA